MVCSPQPEVKVGRIIDGSEQEEKEDFTLMTSFMLEVEQYPPT